MSGNTNEFRPVEIILTGSMSLDAYKSVIKAVEKIEDNARRNVNVETGLVEGLEVTANSKLVLTGNTPYKIYVFNAISLDPLLGKYSLAFLEEAPNVETALSLKK